MNNREMENWLKTLPVLTEVKGEMEIALMEKNTDQVVELIDKLGVIKKESHDQFVEE